ncbi:hypothetical protein DH2020_039472 [Rehmannia glutinosa]|uniref:Uncharacterized protein n=1 Tax=Rehmannia glutinosa TaxID=99300 RepID=A0ABR0UWW4_REHGL
MASGVPWIGDAVGSGIIPLRAVAHFSGHLHSAHPLLHYLRRLRLFWLIYLLIIGATYYSIAKSSFIYIPGYYLGGVHRYTSFLAVGMGILLFLLTSFSDPGVVNSANVSQYLSAYPYDNIIFSEKECSTCKIPKHFLICIYGIVALALILAGRLKELQVIHILTAYYGIEKSFRKLAPLVVQWLLNAYNTQILIMVFLAVVSLLLAGFFTYHTKLCLTNTTTNEPKKRTDMLNDQTKVNLLSNRRGEQKSLSKERRTPGRQQGDKPSPLAYASPFNNYDFPKIESFKWREHLSWQRKVKEAKASAEALKASLGELNQERKPQESKWKTFFRRSRLEELDVVKNNIYDRGFLHNIYECSDMIILEGNVFATRDDLEIAKKQMR